MKNEKDYKEDIAAIRTMMVRSSKFLLLSGWAGVMAGIYALIGAWIAYSVFSFPLSGYDYSGIKTDMASNVVWQLGSLAAVVLILALGTAVFLSYQKATKKQEKLWSTTSKRMIMVMAVPLVVGGLACLIFLSQGLIALVAPLTLLFYGLSLYNASKFTFVEIKVLGFCQMALGLLGLYFTGLGLVLWALGFGVLHIIAGIYLFFKYER